MIRITAILGVIALALPVTVRAACPPPPLLPLGQLVFTIRPGTTDCGGQALVTPPAPPVSGRVDLADGSKRSDLGLGCLYVGDGISLLNFPRIPDGGRSVLEVAGVSGLAVTVTASNGTGPADCTKGAGPGRHCLNGAAGVDGAGACGSDADCGGTVGACELDAHCYFGSPVSLPQGGLSVCIMNGIRENVCGSANLLTRETKVSALLSSRVYLTGNPAAPCPQCVLGRCSAGQRAGLACSGGVGSSQTTIECPPLARQFFGRLDANLSNLDTGTSTLAEPSGNFCPGQVNPGAFGGDASRITEKGAPIFGNLNLFATNLAGTFCVPATGNPFFDSFAGLPGPGAVSVPGLVSINLLR